MGPAGARRFGLPVVSALTLALTGCGSTGNAGALADGPEGNWTASLVSSYGDTYDFPRIETYLYNGIIYSYGYRACN